MLLLFTMLREEQEPTPELAYSDFIISVEDGQVEKITIEDGQITGVRVDGGDFSTYAPGISEDMLALLKEKQVVVRAQPKDEGSSRGARQWKAMARSQRTTSTKGNPER